MPEFKLPISKQEAAQQWQEFEEYLVRERYSVRDPATGAPLEQTYDDVLVRVASCFKDPDVQQALLSKKIITATPFLMNGGNPHTHRKGYYSCYPLGDVEDSTESIFGMERNLATVFQHAGGGGIDVSSLRKIGSPVDNGQGNASGPVSFAKGYSQLSSRISQGGKRRGALMIQMNYTHPDINDFVTFKGDAKGTYTGANVSVNVTHDRFWENEELIDLIAQYMWKSGDPGLLFTKRSVANTPVPAEYNPVYSNPCVPFNTRILTSEGYKKIGLLVHEGWDGDIWNGKEWSQVKPFYTGARKLLKVSFSDGTSLKCTSYHKFILKDSTEYKGEEYRAEACNLKIGERLQKFSMPTVETTTEYPIDAYSQGFYSGDGTKNLNRSKVYSTKYSCCDRLKGEIIPCQTRDDFKYWIHEDMYKSFVPINGNINYCLDWLAGILDADGTVLTYDNSCSLQLCSIDKQFLKDIRLMLTRLGVQAKISESDDREGYRALPDGKGGSKDYYCQRLYRLLINAFDTSHLLELGLRFNRLEATKSSPQRDARRFVTVTAIEDAGFEDVYCFTEGKNNSGTFEGIVTGQCGEYLSIKNTACNLLSVNLQACRNLGHVGATYKDLSLNNFYTQVMDAAKLAAIAGNEILDMGGFPPIPEIKEATLKHRPIGIGFTGLHAAMVHFDIDYKSDEAVEFALEVQACVMIGSMEGSVRYGQAHKYPILEWSKDYVLKLFAEQRSSHLPRIIWERSNDMLEWVNYQGGLFNCVTTSQAPTGSTSQLLHVSSTGIEPYFSMIQKRRVRTADGGWKEFTLVPLEFYDYDQEKLDWIEQQTAHHISPDQQIRILEAVQTFCHTGVSKTINMPASATVADVKAIIMRAKDSNLKGLTIFRDSSMEGVLTDGSKTHEKVKGSEVGAQATIGELIAKGFFKHGFQVDTARELGLLRTQEDTTKVVEEPELSALSNKVEERRTARIAEVYNNTWGRNGANFGVIKPSHDKEALEAEAKFEPVSRRFGDIPNRKGVTYKFSGPSSLYITANFGDRGDVMEVFVNSTKPGSTTHTMCTAIGRLISVGLQYNEELRERQIKTLADMSSDGIWTNAVLGRVCSIPAAVARVLNYHSGQEADLEEGPEFPDGEWAPGYETRAVESMGGIVDASQQSSYSDCPACGMMKLRRDGGCNKCIDCGYTSC